MQSLCSDCWEGIGRRQGGQHRKWAVRSEFSLQRSELGGHSQELRLPVFQRRLQGEGLYHGAPITGRATDQQCVPEATLPFIAPQKQRGQSGSKPSPGGYRTPLVVYFDSLKVLPAHTPFLRLHHSNSPTPFSHLPP